MCVLDTSKVTSITLADAACVFHCLSLHLVPVGLLLALIPNTSHKVPLLILRLAPNSSPTFCPVREIFISTLRIKFLHCGIIYCLLHLLLCLAKNTSYRCCKLSIWVYDHAPSQMLAPPTDGFCQFQENTRIERKLCKRMKNKNK